MTKCRKALSIFLAVMMLVSILPMSTFADDVKTTYNIIINYVYQDGKQAANPYTANIAEGQAFKATVSSPTVVGYKPSQETVEIDIPAVTQGETYTVTYYPAEVEYTVKHYQQNVENDQYTLAYTETKEGLTESAVGSELAKSYDGFTALFYDTETKIAADGSTVVEIYYDRNYYMLNLNLDGGYGAEPVYARYGAPVSVTDPEKPGYTFSGWNPAMPETMPAENKTLKAQWTAGNATYVVQYWQENANDDGYSFFEQVKKSANVGDTVNGSNDKRYAGFTYNSEKTDTNVTVKGDGSTVVNVYYKRNVYEVKFYNSRGTSEYTSKKITAKYGAFIGDKWPGNGWYVKKNSNDTAQSYLAIMPLGGKNFYGQQTGSRTATATYYVEVLPGESGTAVSGKTYKVHHADKANYNSYSYGSFGGGLTVTDEERYDLEGFTCNTSISAKNGDDYDGANFYYTRNSYELVFDDQYGVQVSEQLPFEQVLSESVNHKNNYEPKYPSTLETGAYEFGGWYTDPGCTQPVDWSAKMPAAKVVLYAKWSPVIHTVTTWLTNEMRIPVNVGESNVQSIPHGGSAVKPTDPTNGNYTFVGWFYMEDGVEKAFNFSMAVTKDLELYAKWSSNVPVAFTIKYELEDGTQIADPATGSALAGVTKTFDAKTGTALYEGYQDGYFPQTSSHSITMNIEGGNEFTFVYVKMQEVEYTVKYLEKDTNKELLASKKEVTSFSVVTETFVVVEGYAPDAYQKQLILSANAEENVLIFWYVKDKIHAPVVINHWTQNIEGSDYTKYQSTTDLNGVIGKEYTAESITITGFTYNNGESNATGTLTAAGLELNLYYVRNQYPYEFRYVDSVGDEIAVAESGMARFEAQVTHTARDTYTVGDSVDGITYKLADTANKAMTIQIEKSDKAEVNVVTFKYNRVFTVVHVQEGKAVDTEEIEYNGALRGFSLTNKVPKGYLYGGAFTDPDCTHVQSFNVGENATAFTPEAGATYYIWEVDEAYLIPKNMSAWEHTEPGIVDVMGFFIITPIDREYYRSVGFTVEKNGEIVDLDAKQISESYMGGSVQIQNTDCPVVYESITVALKDGTESNYTVENFNGKNSGYLGCISIDKNTYWKEADEKFSFTPYWVTLDGIKVTSATTRSMVYNGKGSGADVNYKKLVIDSTVTGEVGISLPNSTENASVDVLTVYSNFLASSVISNEDPVIPTDPEEPVEPEEPADPEDPDDGTITVTVNDNGSVYELAVLPGDISGEIEYLGAYGCLFAGWYTDEAYVEPADFTYVTEDITIYAKYVSDAYLQVQFQQKRMSLRGGKATLISAVDSYAYAETGFVINGETIAVSPRDGSRQFYDIRWLFGYGVEKKSPILTTEISAGEYSVGDTIEVTPYWITMDGTTVYGTSSTLTVTRTGFKG